MTWLSINDKISGEHPSNDIVFGTIKCKNINILYIIAEPITRPELF